MTRPQEAVCQGHYKLATWMFRLLSMMMEVTVLKITPAFLVPTVGLSVNQRGIPALGLIGFHPMRCC